MLHKRSCQIFLLTLLACAWFYSPGLWNQSARYDSIQALAERGSFCIDAYLPDPEHNNNTGDWAYAKGHYYSNKAPGSMFLGAMAYAPLYWAERALLGHAPDARLQAVNFRWVNFWCSAVPTALLAVIFYLTMKALGASERRALLCSFALLFTTPLWPYAGAMWGHNLAAMLLGAALLFALRRENSAERAAPLLTGLCAGLAVVTDYLAIAAIPFFPLFFLRQDRWKAFLNYAIGGLLPLFLYCLYHWKCFGNPFLPATFFNNPGFLDAEAAGGIVAGFKTNVVARLLIGMPHGLLWCAPLCLFAVPGARALWRRGGEPRELVGLAAGWFLLSLVLNASFNGWHGGSGIGPRYLLPATPAWAVLAANAPLKSARQRCLALLLGLFATANMLVAASLTPLASERLFNPYLAYWTSFLHDFPRLAAAGQAAWSPAAFIGFRPFADLLLLLPLACAVGRMLHKSGFALPPLQFAQLRAKTITFAQKNWPVLLGLTLLFALPSYIGMMGDEALLQAHAFEANRMLTWAKSGLVGSVGQAYGPLAIWFYQLLQMITPNPIAIVSLKTLLVGLSSLAMLRYLAHRMRIATPIPALLFLLAPYCWHWTRCLWDNVFQLPLELASLTALAAYLEETDAPTPRPIRQTLLLGAAALAAILSLWLHTMALPFLATLPLFLLAIRRDLLRRDGKRILCVALVGAVLAGLILLPRLTQTRRAFATHASFNRTAKVTLWQGAKNALSFPTLLSSATFEDEQMTSPIADFTAVWKPLWRTLGYAMLALTLCLLAAGLAAVCRNRQTPAGQLGLFALINILLQILFVLATRLQFFPHYHQSVLMSTLLLAAIGAATLHGQRTGRLAWRLWCALGAFSIMVFLSHLALTGGEDRPPYGMTLAEQWPALRTVAIHAQTGQPLHLVVDNWQYASLPVCLNILSHLAQADVAGRVQPRFTPEENPPRRVWRLVNPVPACGFLRIADTTDPANPKDVPIER